MCTRTTLLLEISKLASTRVLEAVEIVEIVWLGAKCHRGIAITIPLNEELVVVLHQQPDQI